LEPRTLQFIAEASGAGDPSPEKLHSRVFGVCTDSRLVKPGDLFVALAGDRFDAHEFLEDVIRFQPGGLLVHRSPPDDLNHVPVLKVDDTRLALGRLAAAYCQQFPALRIAVVGSNGKTSTKELIASVLKEKMAALWSEASFNNDVGVPLTLLRLASEHQVAILEVGTNHPGELTPLLQMIRPHWGVLTGIGREHLEHFHSIEGVVEEEGTIAGAIPSHGTLFLNGDDPHSGTVIRRAECSVVTVGFGEANHWRATRFSMDADGVRFAVRSPWWSGEEEFEIRLLGRHQVGNALLAMAVGKELGLGLEEIRTGLKNCAPAKLRLQMSAYGEVSFLEDCYNANPDSTGAALETLAALPCGGRRIAILGDMAELGETALSAHEEIGRKAVELGIEIVAAVGVMAGTIVDSCKKAGLKEAFPFGSIEAASEGLGLLMMAGDLILLKASRTVKLEQLGILLKEKCKKTV